MKKVKCHICKKEFALSSLGRHVVSTHNKNRQDYVRMAEGKIEACEFCGKERVVISWDGKLTGTCLSKECESSRRSKHSKEMTRKGNNPLSKHNRKKDEQGRDLYTLAAVNKMLADGTHPFSKANRPKTEDGKDMMSLASYKSQIEAGTHAFLSKNLKRDSTGKSIIHVSAQKAAVVSGKKHFLKANRPKTEDGKDLYSVARRKHAFKDPFSQSKTIHPHIVDREHLHDRDFCASNFSLPSGEIDADAYAKYHNLSASAHNALKYIRNMGLSPKLNIPRAQKEVYSWIQSIYSGEVIQNDRKVLSGKEIDIYVPNKNIAIEYDGLYWHSEGAYDNWNNLDEYTHLNKTKACEEAGIKLFHIFENEWSDPRKQKIWKSMISNSLGKSTYLSLSECEVKKLDSNPSQFLEENHLHGSISGKDLVAYGCYYKEELVAVRTFCKARRTLKRHAQWEGLRFCTKIGYSVRNLYSHLLSLFIEEHKPNSIGTYVDRRYSNGKMLSSLDWTKVAETYPNFYWYRPNESILRSNRFGWKYRAMSNYKEGMTQEETMFDAGYRRIYNCGNLCYVLTIKQPLTNE